jgi:hypothetical protein
VHGLLPVLELALPEQHWVGSLLSFVPFGMQHLPAPFAFIVQQFAALPSSSFRMMMQHTPVGSA